jgi:PAS domain S-box-containing protein
MLNATARKVFLQVTLLAIVPMTGLGVLLYHQGKSAIEKEVLSSLLLARNAVESGLDVFIRQKLARAEDFASDGYIRAALILGSDGEGSILPEFLAEHLEVYKLHLGGDLAAIAVCDANDVVIASAQQAKVPADYAANMVKDSSIHLFEQDGNWFLQVRNPVYEHRGDADSYRGSLINLYSLYELEDIVLKVFRYSVADVPRPLLGQVMVMDNNGNSVFGDLAPLGEDWKESEIGASILAGENLFGAIKLANGERFLGFAFSRSGPDFRIVGLIPEEDIFHPIQRWALVSSGWISGVTVLVIALMVWRANRLGQPFARAAVLAERISAGAFGERLELGKRNKDVSRMQVSFNQMLDRLEGSIEQARQSDLRYQKVAQVTNDAIWDWDLKSNRMVWNEGFEKLFGYQREAVEPDARSWFNHIHPEDVERVRQKILNVLETAQEEWQDDYRYQCFNGSFAYVMDRGAILRDAEGKAIRMIGGMTDITARELLKVELEQRVQERTEQLAVINTELESFCYSVSHDLRAPLRGISGFADAIQDDYKDVLDETGCNYLQRITAGAERMGHLIDDLLDLSRVSRLELRREEVNLSNLAREICDEIHGREPDRVVDWKIADGCIVSGDTRLWRIALENLLQNAWKFTARKENAQIAFVWEHLDDGTCQIGVKDNGAGFDPRYVEKLFAPFQRLHKMEDFVGTGIGLATVKRIVSRHGGKVFASGTLDQGAYIGFILLAHHLIK